MNMCGHVHVRVCGFIAERLHGEVLEHAFVVQLTLSGVCKQRMAGATHRNPPGLKWTIRLLCQGEGRGEVNTYIAVCHEVVLRWHRGLIRMVGSRA